MQMFLLSDMSGLSSAAATTLMHCGVYAIWVFVTMQVSAAFVMLLFPEFQVFKELSALLPFGCVLFVFWFCFVVCLGFLGGGRAGGFRCVLWFCLVFLL